MWVKILENVIHVSRGSDSVLNIFIKLEKVRDVFLVFLLSITKTLFLNFTKMSIKYMLF